MREYLLYLLSVLLDTTFLHLISGNVWPILTSGGHVTKCTFLCAPQKEHRQALEILFLSFSGVDFKPVAGIRKLSKVRKCHPTLQKTSSIFSMWRLGFFFPCNACCVSFWFLHSNPGICYILALICSVESMRVHALQLLLPGFL